jgi:hypothetical protein
MEELAVEKLIIIEREKAKQEERERIIKIIEKIEDWGEWSTGADEWSSEFDTKESIKELIKEIKKDI